MPRRGQGQAYLEAEVGGMSVFESAECRLTLRLTSDACDGSDVCHHLECLDELTCVGSTLLVRALGISGLARAANIRNILDHTCDIQYN